MSADAASLPCPICLHTGVFQSVETLRDRLIFVSTHKLLCPVCQEEICGLDKLTIHLFSHVKLVSSNASQLNITNKQNNPPITKVDAQPKKIKSNQISKNKQVSAPVKYVKIYPKLPVISLNTVPGIDISRKIRDNGTQDCNSIIIPTLKTESLILPTNTTCEVCGLQFVDENILKMHKNIIHNINENESQNYSRYNCHLCPKNFKMRGSLMVHLRMAHYGFSSSKHVSETKKNEDQSSSVNPEDRSDTSLERNENKQWQCDVCHKCFTTKYFLKKHKRLHTGETPYACTQCNKSFTFQQSYHKHLLYHNDEKPHTCSYCGRAFKELSTLHNHQRIHTGEKPFSCETCGKSFRQRVSYLVHRRIHTGVMPYKCTACEKSFRYKVSQRTHKCQSQPPGTVIRQTCELLQKLKNKHVDTEVDKAVREVEETVSATTVDYTQVSEANVELVRKGAYLSLEDMESENFSLITDLYHESSSEINANLDSENEKALCNNDKHLFDSNIDDLVTSMAVEDKNIPSPSDILKNLCLSQEDDYKTINLMENGVTKSHDLISDFNMFI